MKRFLKPIKYLLVLLIGVGLARFLFFRDSIKSIPVRNITPIQKEIIKTVSALGEVKSNKEASVAFTTNGTVGWIAVSKGDNVTQGQLIASLLSPESEHTIQIAKDSRDIALRERDLFIENYKKKSDRDVLGGETQYEIQLRTYNEYVSKAEANYQSSLASYSRNYLYAPFEGKILDVYKTKGEVATVSEPIIKLAKDDLVFEINVDQSDFGLLKEEQSVELSLDAFEKEKFIGKVGILPEYANGGSNPTFTINIIFENPEGKILLGMRGDARITVASTEREVTALLYDEVLYDSEEKAYLWTVQNGVLEKQYVETGLEGDLYTEIESDLSNVKIVGPQNSNIQIEQGYKAKIQNE